MNFNFNLVCLHCGKTFTKKYPYSLKRMRTFRFCGSHCSTKHGNSGLFIEGHQGIRGKKNPSWKGERAGYRAIHSWAHRRINRQNHCQECGENNRVLTDSLGRTRNYLQLANISGEYRREIADWTFLCPSCHARFDKGRDSIKKVFLSTERANP